MNKQSKKELKDLVSDVIRAKTERAYLKFSMAFCYEMYNEGVPLSKTEMLNLCVQGTINAQAFIMTTITSELKGPPTDRGEIYSLMISGFISAIANNEFHEFKERAVIFSDILDGILKLEKEREAECQAKQEQV